MSIPLPQLENLIQSPAYQNIPIEMAIESGFTSWWAQASHMADTAGKMAVWEVASALEMMFEAYEDLDLEIKLRFTVLKDMDPSGKKVEILVNGRFFEADNNQIEKNLCEKIREKDNFQALEFLEKTASQGLLTNRTVIAQTLNEGLNRRLNNANQARKIRQEFAPDVSSRIEGVLLALEAPTAQVSRPRPRM